MKIFIKFLLIACIGALIINSSSCKKDDDNVITQGVKDIDGNIYDTITIGTQVWMVQNLRVMKLNDGTAIPKKTDWIFLSNPAYCWYNNNSTLSNSDYGVLYNWHAVNTEKLCPKGWHVPTDTEWATLIVYLGGESVAGGKLKEADTTHWESPNTSATNESGFTALPGGVRDNFGVSFDFGITGLWWSATQEGPTTAWGRYISNDDANIFRNSYNKSVGLSVRCVKD